MQGTRKEGRALGSWLFICGWLGDTLNAGLQLVRRKTNFVTTKHTCTEETETPIRRVEVGHNLSSDAVQR
jgi:thiamine monophosphate kinase